MKEQTQSRLTLFAHLWAVSMVLFAVLCIVAVYGGMNDHKNLMGLGIVSFCAVFIIQICQSIAAIMVRRWWCFAFSVIGILVSLFILICCIVALGAGQYRPPRAAEEVCDTTETEIDYSFPVEFKGEEPTIIDFVTALSSHEDMGEALGWMKKNWELYQQGKPLPKDMTFDVDLKNAYFRYNMANSTQGGSVRSGFIEFVCWNFADTKQKLIVHNTVDYFDGKPIIGQFSGLSYYIYDNDTKRMAFVSPDKLNAYLDTMPEDTQIIVSKLPRKGNAIECKCYTPTRETTIHLIWNSNKFDQVHQ